VKRLQTKEENPITVHIPRQKSNTKVYVHAGPESALKVYKYVHVAFIVTFTGATDTVSVG